MGASWLVIAALVLGAPMAGSGVRGTPAGHGLQVPLARRNSIHT